MTGSHIFKISNAHAAELDSASPHRWLFTIDNWEKERRYRVESYDALRRALVADVRRNADPRQILEDRLRKVSLPSQRTGKVSPTAVATAKKALRCLNAWQSSGLGAQFSAVDEVFDKHAIGKMSIKLGGMLIAGGPHLSLINRRTARRRLLYVSGTSFDEMTQLDLLELLVQAVETSGIGERREIGLIDFDRTVVISPKSTYTQRLRRLGDKMRLLHELLTARRKRAA